MSATDHRMIARLSIDALYSAERDARETAQQLSDEIASMHTDGRGNDPLCDKLMIDYQFVMARIKRLEGLVSAAENDVDGGQWL